MTKDKFLCELEKKLSILSEEERKDTINEYRDIIEEKVKHGKKECEAVKEFGSIDELAKEILSAYKINPDYKKSETGTKTKDLVDEAEEMIRKGAKKISEVADDVVDSFKKSDFEWTTANVFEIVIKVIILLIFLAILKIPIHFIAEIGSNVFGIGIEPFSSIFGTIWKVLIEVVYLVICILLVVKIITDYTNNQCKKDSNKSNKTKKEKHSSVEKNEIKNDTKVKKNNTFENIVLIIIKLFVIFVFIIPLIAIAGLIIIGLIILIYLICKGIGVYGFTITAIGCLGFICSVIDLICRGLITNKKVYLFPFIINIILIIIGGVMSLAYIFDFEFHDYLPENKYEIKTKTYTENINEKTSVLSDNSSVIIDNNLEDNKIKLEVTYYSEFINIEKHEDRSDNNRYLSFVPKYKDITYSLNNRYTKMFLEDIKNKDIYNYNYLDEVSVKIYVNENTKDLVEN